MKIDAEGMEMQVLEGSIDTLRRCRPVLYLEFLKNDKAGLHERVAALDYAVYENGINFLCIPAALKDRIQVNQAPASTGLD